MPDCMRTIRASEVSAYSIRSAPGGTTRNGLGLKTRWRWLRVWSCMPPRAQRDDSRLFATGPLWRPPAGSAAGCHAIAWIALDDEALTTGRLSRNANTSLRASLWIIARYTPVARHRRGVLWLSRRQISAAGLPGGRVDYTDTTEVGGGQRTILHSKLRV